MCTRPFFSVVVKVAVFFHPSSPFILHLSSFISHLILHLSSHPSSFLESINKTRVSFAGSQSRVSHRAGNISSIIEVLLFILHLTFHPSSLILHLSSFILHLLHPSSLILHPSSFILHPSSHPSSLISSFISHLILHLSSFILHHPSSFILSSFILRKVYKYR
jgi:hypothetical protein